MNLLLTLFYFLLAVCLLIIVHEYGHFIVARFFNVKVLRFSVGFGKPLIRFKDKKGTEYTLCALPLGGYVKMLDEDEAPVSKEELPYAYNKKSPWIRIAIAIAGPLFNFIFAVFALWFMFMLGIKTLAPIVATVTPHSIAYQAGIKPMDEFVSMGERRVMSWRDVQVELISHVGDKEALPIEVKTQGISEKRQLDLNMADFKLSVSHPDALESLGVSAYIPKILAVVGQVIENGAANRFGIKVGDEVLAVDGNKVKDWFDVVSAIKHSPSKPVVLTIKRDSQMISRQVVPDAKKVDGKTIGFIGLLPKKETFPVDLIRLQRYGAGQSFVSALNETWHLSSVSFKMLAKLVGGEMSVRNIGGPIGIAEGARQSARGGLSYYLSFLALISVSLGLLNLLPIPMLDGGHVLFYLLEIVLGRPLEESVKNTMMITGLVMLLAVTGLAFFNDIVRLLH